MGHRNKSQASTATKLTSGQDDMASSLDDLLAKISEMEKSVEELRLLLPIPAVTTPIDGLSFFFLFGYLDATGVTCS